MTELEIRELTPALSADYFELFDNAFRDNPWWAGCYCGYYDDPCSAEEWDPTNDGERIRANRAAHIATGRARGLLGYEHGRPIGWCNAAPRSSFGNLRQFDAAGDDLMVEAGLVMCFVVDPDHRGKGVARTLLAGALEAFTRWGLQVAEAYPRSSPPAPDFPATAAYYKGSLDMYLEAGFRVARTLDGFHVVRKDL